MLRRHPRIGSEGSRGNGYLMLSKNKNNIQFVTKLVFARETHYKEITNFN